MSRGQQSVCPVVPVPTGIIEKGKGEESLVPAEGGGGGGGGGGVGVVPT